MKDQTLYLNIVGLSVVFKTEIYELFDRIAKDFSFFKRHSNNQTKKNIAITAYLERPNYTILKYKKKWRTSKNSITYDDGDIRYNDYHGKLLSIYNYSKEEGFLWSQDIQKLHEITYLLILSRTGKILDLQGFHKVHAMGIIYRGNCLIGMMNSGVGKSTLLKELLYDKEVEFLSDDTPLVDREGVFHPFPLRLGFNEYPKGLAIKNPEKNIYRLQREFYGQKTLVCIDGLSNPMAHHYRRLIIFEGRQIKGDRTIIRKQYRFLFFCSLLKHMVIGVGLPIIFEYFWRSGLYDFYTKTQIALKRLKTAWILVIQHDSYTIGLGENNKGNAERVKKFINSLSNTGN